MIDCGYGLSYQRDSYESSAKSFDQALALANTNVIGLSVEEVLAEFPAETYGIEPIHKQGCLFLADICLKLDRHDHVVSVEID